MPPRTGGLVGDGAERRTHVDLVVVQQTEEEAAVADEPVCADADAAPMKKRGTSTGSFITRERYEGRAPGGKVPSPRSVLVVLLVVLLEH